MASFISEDQIERALLQKLQHFHGYAVLDCDTEDREDLADGSGRADKREVILRNSVTSRARCGLASQPSRPSCTPS